MINRVRIVQVLHDMSTRDVITFRMGGTQDEAEEFGHLLQTRWMEENPGFATVMIIDWPTPQELGMKFHIKPSPQVWHAY